MELNRQELLTLATTVGLVLGVDFEKNISNINLQKKIEDKQEELANSLKDNDTNNTTQPTPPTDDEVLALILKGLESSELKEEDLSEHDKALLVNERQRVLEEQIKKDSQIKDEKKIEELEDNALIMRKTECFTYRTEIIGFKETARRSNLTVKEVKEAIETGKPTGGYIFEFVG